MRPIRLRRTWAVLSWALLGILAGGPGCSSAAAQIRGAAGGARTVWTPPFAQASGEMLTGVQNFMKTPAGTSLLAGLPDLTAVQSFSPTSESDLRVVGALAAHLPQGFEARLTAAARGAAADPEEAASLAKVLGGAYQAAALEVAQAVEARSRQVALSVAYGQMDGPELGAAASQLERFGIYGPVVKGKSAVVRNMAAQGAMGRAQSIAAEFVRRMRVADDQVGPGKDEAVDSAAPGDGKKPMPDGWKLGGQQEDAEPKKPEPPPPGAKTASGGRTESSQRQAPRFEEFRFKSAGSGSYSRRPAPEPKGKAPDAPAKKEAPSGPKPSPLSDDFYERLGADRKMSQDGIKTAYRKASMLYHPDRYLSTQSPEAIKALTVAFQRIQEAYQTLSDPKKRADYDRRSPGPRTVRR